MKSPVNGILAIWHDLAPGSEGEFQEWHTREHMPERLSVPGFLRGCRYAAVESSPQVFNFYVTDAPEVLMSPAYLARLNDPTEWTRRVVPTLQNVNRSAGRVAASLGAGQGGSIATLRVSPQTDKIERFRSWFVKEGGLQKLLEMTGVVAAHLWQSDSAASGIETAESRARGSQTDIADWTVAIEGNDLQFVRSASDWLQQQDGFSSSLPAEAITGFYRLQHHLNSPVSD